MGGTKDGGLALSVGDIVGIGYDLTLRILTSPLTESESVT